MHYDKFNAKQLNTIIQFYLTHSQRETLATFHIRSSSLHKILAENNVPRRSVNESCCLGQSHRKAELEPTKVIAYYKTHSFGATYSFFSYKATAYTWNFVSK